MDNVSSHPPLKNCYRFFQLLLVSPIDIAAFVQLIFHFEVNIISFDLTIFDPSVAEVNDPEASISTDGSSRFEALLICFPKC